MHFLVLFFSLNSLAAHADTWPNQFWDLYNRAHKPDPALFEAPAVFQDGLTYSRTKGASTSTYFYSIQSNSPSGQTYHLGSNNVNQLTVDERYALAYHCRRMGRLPFSKDYPKEIASLPTPGIRFWEETPNGKYNYLPSAAWFLRQYEDANHESWLLGVATCADSLGCGQFKNTEPVSYAYWRISSKVSPSAGTVSNPLAQTCGGYWTSANPGGGSGTIFSPDYPIIPFPPVF